MAGIKIPVAETVAARAPFARLAPFAVALLGAMALLTHAAAQSPEAQPDVTTTPAVATETAPATTAPAPVADYGGDRAAAYKAFREHFEARRFAEALPAAQQLVAITEQKFGKDALELATPLMNLGTTNQRLGDFNAAALQYQRALRIVETRHGGFSREIIQPLLGLGVAYTAAGDYDASARSLRRAMDVSRKLNGLFNPQQLELVEPLVASYVALGQYEDAAREQQYALRLAETAYGRNDPRLLPSLEHSARWLENTGHYAAARNAYARALDIARKAGENDLRMVAPLRGIARMYRMEFLHGAGPVEQAESGSTSSQAGGTVYGEVTPSTALATTGLNDAGEDALELALHVLDQHPAESLALRGDTLLDLGDWNMIAGRTRDAMRRYKEAWLALSAQGATGTAVLDTPRQLIYRPPSSGRRNPAVDAEEYQELFVEVEFTVTPEGRVKDATIVAQDAAEASGKSVITALRRSRYRPRLVDGAPVATAGVRHRQAIYVRS